MHRMCRFQKRVVVRGVYPGVAGGKFFAIHGKVVHQPEGLLSVRLSDVMVLHHIIQNVRQDRHLTFSSPGTAHALLAGLASKNLCGTPKMRIPTG